MNKRFWLGFIIVAVFITLYEWVFHGIMLKGDYIATAHLWRPEAEMESYFAWMFAGQLLFSFIFCLLFTFTRCQTNFKDGATYGLVIGLLMSSVSLVYYAVMPIPMSLLAGWILGGIIETIIAGAIFALVYIRTQHKDEL
ncbi:MAG: hypothetical protein ACRBBR_07710 [Cellvibrionaceae bacterium]